MHDRRSEDAFLKGAYGLADVKSAMEFYTRWAEAYDERMESTLGYVAPRLMAEVFSDAMSDHADPIVLDVGCGTGLTSHYLSTHGFRAIDGIDLNPPMLEQAEKRAIYRRLIQSDITKPIDLPDAAYDGIISSGTFTLGHVGSEPINELVRMLKPGGILGCTVHVDIWIRDGFSDCFARLEGDGILKARQRMAGEFFSGYGETAYYCLFEKSGDGSQSAT